MKYLLVKTILSDSIKDGFESVPDCTFEASRSSSSGSSRTENTAMVLMMIAAIEKTIAVWEYPIFDGRDTPTLMIPNAEVRDIYQTTIIKWFDESAQTWDRKGLFDAVWHGDSAAITREMSKLLRKTISYHDYREDFYHAFLAGIFTGAGYMVESNKEHGEGRSDVIVHDSVNARIAIFEAKYAKTVKTLQDACDMAIQQINDRMYAAEFEDDYDDILCYGIAFFKKRCVVKKKSSI